MLCVMLPTTTAVHLENNVSFIGIFSIPGRNMEITLEALDLSNSVLSFVVSARHKRPGPNVGCRICFT